MSQDDFTKRGHGRPEPKSFQKFSGRSDSQTTYRVQQRQGGSGGVLILSESRLSSTPVLEKTIVVPIARRSRPFHDPTFLHQKYVVEGLSPKEIAVQIFSSRQSIIKYLKQFEIELRQQDKPRHGPPAFGQRWMRFRVVEYRREQKIAERMMTYRAKGFSYQRIATELNSTNTKAKTLGAKWHAQSVYRVLSRLTRPSTARDESVAPVHPAPPLTK